MFFFHQQKESAFCTLQNHTSSRKFPFLLPFECTKITVSPFRASAAGFWTSWTRREPVAPAEAQWHLGCPMAINGRQMPRQPGRRSKAHWQSAGAGFTMGAPAEHRSSWWMTATHQQRVRWSRSSSWMKNARRWTRCKVRSLKRRKPPKGKTSVLHSALKSTPNWW